MDSSLQDFPVLCHIKGVFHGIYMYVQFINLLTYSYFRCICISCKKACVCVYVYGHMSYNSRERLNLGEKKCFGRMPGSLWSTWEHWRARQEPRQSVRWPAPRPRSQQRNSLVRVTQLRCWTLGTATGTTITGHRIRLRLCHDCGLLLAPLPPNT